MIRIITTALFISILGGCSAHVALLAQEKQITNQQEYIDQYDYEISLMEAKDYE